MPKVIIFFQQAALLEHQQAKLIQEQIELQKAVSFSHGIALTITVLYSNVYEYYIKYTLNCQNVPQEDSRKLMEEQQKKSEFRYVVVFVYCVDEL